MVELEALRRVGGRERQRRIVASGARRAGRGGRRPRPRRSSRSRNGAAQARSAAASSARVTARRRRRVARAGDRRRRPPPGRLARRTRSGRRGSVAAASARSPSSVGRSSGSRDAIGTEREPPLQRDGERRQELAVRPGQERPASRRRPATPSRIRSARRDLVGRRPARGRGCPVAFGRGLDDLGEPLAVVLDQPDGPPHDRSPGSGSWSRGRPAAGPAAHRRAPGPGGRRPAASRRSTGRRRRRGRSGSPAPRGAGPAGAGSGRGPGPRRRAGALHAARQRASTSAVRSRRRSGARDEVVEVEAAAPLDRALVGDERPGDRARAPDPAATSSAVTPRSSLSRENACRAGAARPAAASGATARRTVIRSTSGSTAPTGRRAGSPARARGTSGREPRPARRPAARAPPSSRSRSSSAARLLNVIAAIVPGAAPAVDQPGDPGDERRRLARARPARRTGSARAAPSRPPAGRARAARAARRRPREVHRTSRRANGLTATRRSPAAYSPPHRSAHPRVHCGSRGTKRTAVHRPPSGADCDRRPSGSDSPGWLDALGDPMSASEDVMSRSSPPTRSALAPRASSTASSVALAASALIGVPAAAQASRAKPRGPNAPACRPSAPNGAVKHVIYIQFDNTHLLRDTRERAVRPRADAEPAELHEGQRHAAVRTTTRS